MPIDLSGVKWDSAPSPFDAALQAEGLTGRAADVARSIYQQESSSGKNTKTSNAGAVGGMQIIPSTFKSVADKDWDINDPTHNARAGIRYVKQLFEQAGGDPALTAAGYYGGPGGLEKARRGVAVSDPRNPNAPNTLQYGQQVAARIPKERGMVQRAVEAVIPSANAAERVQGIDLNGVKWDEPASTEGVPRVEVTGTAADEPGMAASLGAGLGKGFGSVVLGAQNYAGKGLEALGAEQAGQWLQKDATEGRARLTAENAPYKAANPITNATGEIGGNIVSTLPATAALGAGVAATGAARLGSAISSGGMTVGQQGGNALANMALRMAGGATAGGVSAGLVDPESAGTGAAIGAALPPVLRAAGAAGGAIGRAVRGPVANEATQVAAQAGRQAGYVIPPTQVRPTLTNRLLEGFSGKLTTAQNASAKNQEVTNALAKKAIGADELSAEGLAAVRAKANSAYDQLGQVGAIQADDAFRTAMDQIGSRSRQLKADFPELVNKDVDALTAGFAGKSGFDAQSAIEAMKQLRASGSANKANFTDPEKKALGQAQMKMAGALEDLVERNLQASGQPQLLEAFRAARKTLAKTYDVEKAMNPASGNVDARKLAQALKKGRPLTEELDTIARFSSSFPKATQAVEGMGSLPQTSPLDWGASIAASVASGNPLPMLGVMARPAARSLTLSGAVQNRLIPAASAPGIGFSPARNALLEGAYRGAPLLGSSR